jgi:hypothetical protein
LCDRFEGAIILTYEKDCAAGFNSIKKSLFNEKTIAFVMVIQKQLFANGFVEQTAQ